MVLNKQNETEYMNLSHYVLKNSIEMQINMGKRKKENKSTGLETGNSAISNLKLQNSSKLAN